MVKSKKTVPPLPKIELLARLDKLQRANVSLRAKNKHLASTATELSEALDNLWGERPVDVTLMPRRIPGGKRKAFSKKA